MEVDVAEGQLNISGELTVDNGQVISQNGFSLTIDLTPELTNGRLSERVGASSQTPALSPAAQPLPLLTSATPESGFVGPLLPNNTTDRFNIRFFDALAPIPDETTSEDESLPTPEESPQELPDELEDRQLENDRDSRRRPFVDPSQDASSDDDDDDPADLDSLDDDGPSVGEGSIDESDATEEDSTNDPDDESATDDPTSNSQGASESGRIEKNPDNTSNRLRHRDEYVQWRRYVRPFDLNSTDKAFDELGSFEPSPIADRASFSIGATIRPPKPSYQQASANGDTPAPTPNEQPVEEQPAEQQPAAATEAAE